MAAGSTYTPIATQTMTSATASVTFSSISGSYTDLVLVVAGQASGAQRNLLLQFNGDTGANYSVTILYGDGSTAGSDRLSSQNSAFVGGLNNTTQSNSIINIMNYSNTTTYKTTIGRNNSSTVQVASKVTLWRNTAAITSIVAFLVGSDTFTTGTTLTLYGIAAA
jgi:anti-sigma-K factor RskA